jgi:ABC-2 type transport system ATP-binding protein
MQPAILVEQLCKSYQQTRVVDEISFEVFPGEIFAFLGPNGAGKTTTIRMIIGEITKDQGNIEISGLKIPEQIEQAKKMIGVVPDHQNLYDRLTVRQNLEFFADLNEIDHNEIDKTIEKVFLVEHQHKQTQNLSRGLRQRTLIARGLLHKPDIFFLDEPTSALDPNSAMLIRNLVKELQNQGTTVLLTTHYMEEADSLCDRLAIIHNGKIVAKDTSESLKAKFAENYLTIDYEENQKTRSENFSLSDPESKKRVSQIILEKNVKKIHSHEPSLEEVFLRATGAKWESDSGEILK